MSQLSQFFDNTADFCKDTYNKAAITTMALIGGLSLSASAQNKATRAENDQGLWAFQAGYVMKSKNALYTPTGLFWEAIVPGWRGINKVTSFRGGYELIKEGEINYEFSGNNRYESYKFSGRQLYSQAYLDVRVGPTLGNEDSPIRAQPYMSAGLGFAPGAEVNSAWDISSYRLGAGINAHLTLLNMGTAKLAFFANAEIMKDIRENRLVYGVIPTNELYKKEFLPVVKGGLSLVY